jgi:hypothetical protein
MAVSFIAVFLDFYRLFTTGTCCLAKKGLLKSSTVLGEHFRYAQNQPSRNLYVIIHQNPRLGRIPPREEEPQSRRSLPERHA